MASSSRAVDSSQEPHSASSSIDLYNENHRLYEEDQLEKAGNTHVAAHGLPVPVSTAYHPPHSPQTSRKEIWSYYSYYIGANGIALFNFGPNAFQNLVDQAGPPDSGLLHFAGKSRNVNSIVLLCNGISFAIQTVLFLIIGAYADFGTGRRWILVFWSVVAYGIGFAWLAVHDASKWHVGAGLYIVGLIAYQLTLTYWTAAFPSLARNTPYMRESQAQLGAGQITQREFDKRDEVERSRLSNESFFLQSIGSVVVLAIVVGIMYGVHVQRSVVDNNWGLSVIVAFATAVWVVTSMPWFLYEKKRPGLPIPQGLSMFTVGLWQIKTAFMQILCLKQSLIYLVGFFLLGDALTTTYTVVATLQAEATSFNSLTLIYLLAVGCFTQGIGILVYWEVQKRYRVSAKSMFNAVMVSIVLADLWGLVGNWSDSFGFKKEWEFWVYSALFGLFACAWYSYSQILISSVTPRGHEFLFFSVFNIIGKSSSILGPVISSAIIDASPGKNKNNAPFYFLFALSVVSTIGIWGFLDLDESAREQEIFLNAQQKGREFPLDGSIEMSIELNRLEQQRCRN